MRQLDFRSHNLFDPVSAVLTFPEGVFQCLRKTVLLMCANSDQAGIIVHYLGSTSRAGHTVYMHAARPAHGAASTFLNELRESHEVILPSSKVDECMYTCRPRTTCTTDICIYACMHAHAHTHTHTHTHNMHNSIPPSPQLSRLLSLCRSAVRLPHLAGARWPHLLMRPDVCVCVCVTVVIIIVIMISL